MSAATLAEMKAAVADILQRPTTPPTILYRSVQTAQNRAQRLLRIPSMERTAEQVIDPTDTEAFPTPGHLAIPADLLELKNLYVNGVPLQRISFDDYMTRSKTAGANPVAFCRSGSNWLITPVPATAFTVSAYYYAEFEPLVADSDTNALLGLAYDAVLYLAASEAAEYWSDERGPIWESKALTSFTEIQTHATRSEYAGSELVVAAPGAVGDYGSYDSGGGVIY